MPGPCICSGLPVANCLRQLCPLGTRSLSAQASSCGSPFGAVLVLGSLRSPAGKKPFIAHFDGGARYVARSGVGQLTPTVVRARSSPFSAVKMGGPFSLRCLSPLCSGAVGGGQAYPLRVKMAPAAWRSCSAKYEGFCFRRSRRGAGLPHARPASREARCRAAVASRPCRMSPERPARRRRAVRGAGRREEARAQWAQPPQAVSDRQPSTETRI